MSTPGRLTRGFTHEYSLLEGRRTAPGVYQ